MKPIERTAESVCFKCDSRKKRADLGDVFFGYDSTNHSLVRLLAVSRMRRATVPNNSTSDLNFVEFTPLNCKSK